MAGEAVLSLSTWIERAVHGWLGRRASPPDHALPHPPPCPPAAPVALTDLPLEIFRHFDLPLPALSTLASTCWELHRRLPDHLWHPPLRALAQTIEAELLRLPLAAESRLSGPQHPGGTLHDEDVQLLQLARVARHALEQPRALARRLREAACALCARRGASATVFPLTARGVCAACDVDRAALCEAWRRRQACRELAVRQLADERTRRALSSGLDEALRDRRRGEELKLLFDSSVAGNSLPALLRAADGAAASILLIREREAGHAFGAFLPCGWSERHAAEDGFFSDERCFLFALAPSPTRVFPARDEPGGHHAHCSATHGIGFGGEVGCFGLQVHADLMSGVLLPSLTYGTCDGMASSSSFLIASVQLWGLVDDTLPLARPRAEWETSGAKSAMEDPQNRILLEFVGMERSLACDSRFGK